MEIYNFGIEEEILETNEQDTLQKFNPEAHKGKEAFRLLETISGRSDISEDNVVFRGNLLYKKPLEKSLTMYKFQKEKEGFKITRNEDEIFVFEHKPTTNNEPTSLYETIEKAEKYNSKINSLFN